MIGFGSLFAIWHIASVYLLNSVLFPPPARVIAKAIELAQDGTLWENASISLQRIALGFFFGALIGIPLGLAIGSFGIVRRILEPYTEFLRFIPATALITVAVIWFGIGEGSKIFLIIYTTVFIVIINTAAGVSAVAPNKIRAATVARRQPRAGVLLRRPAGDRALHPHRHAPRHGQFVRDHHRRGAGCRQRGPRQDDLGRAALHAGRPDLRGSACARLARIYGGSAVSLGRSTPSRADFRR